MFLQPAAGRGAESQRDDELTSTLAVQWQQVFYIGISPPAGQRREVAFLGAPSVSDVPGPKCLSAACLGPDISLFLAGPPPPPRFTISSFCCSVPCNPAPFPEVPPSAPVSQHFPTARSLKAPGHCLPRGWGGARRLPGCQLRVHAAVRERQM